MNGQQPFVTTASGKRQFACSPVALLGIVVDEAERILLLSHPKRNGTWEPVNGAWEAGESMLDGMLRETYEEAGPDLKVRPSGVVHVYNFHYDADVRYMIGVVFLLAYEGGRVQPGDDMLGSQYRWWRLEELEKGSIRVLWPAKWILRRAVELYHLWQNQEVELQPELAGRA